MAVLPISTHAARWDLEDALRSAGADLALLDAYDEMRERDHAAELDAVEQEADGSFEAGRAVGLDVGYAAGKKAAEQCGAVKA